MNANPDILLPLAESGFVGSASSSETERIVEFYEEATADYEHWSENFNMHLGFYRRGLDFFRRETMLEQMNIELAERLRIHAETERILIDLGCGTGAVSRTIARKFPKTKIKGVTLSPLQVELAAKLNECENLNNRIEIFEGDYTNLPLETRSADAVWAIESACYADGSGKENLIREMARVLKSDGRFAVADCFVKQPDKEFDFLTEKCYRTVCDCWALKEMPTLEDFTMALEENNFRDIVVEDISWRITPSLLHAPLSVFSFVVRKILSGERLKPQSINNLKASLLALILGLNRAKFSYCLISGTRK